jgi:hypothetical protein
MNKNKAVSAKDGSNTDLIEQLTMTNHNPNQNKFQYDCSFCLRELPSGGHRFDGFGACPRCYRLAHHFVDALRGHRANYFSNLGVKR